MEQILNEILSTLKEHSKRFDLIDVRFDSVDREISEVKTRLGKVEDRVGDVEVRLGKVEDRVGDVEVRLGKVENRVGDVEVRLGKVENRVGDVEVSLVNVEEHLSEKIDHNAIEFRSHFKHIETKLEQHQQTFLVISAELKGTKIDIEHLSKKSGLHDTEINQLKKRVLSY